MPALLCRARCTAPVVPPAADTVLSDAQQAIKDKLAACDSANLLSDSQWNNFAQCSADDIEAYFTQEQVGGRGGASGRELWVGL